MTEQEQQLIRDLFQQLRQLDGQPKDVQADASIRQLAAQAPDAAYWLTQRTLLLEQSLQQAQQQIAQLQDRLTAATGNGTGSGTGSFLSPAPGLDTRFGRNTDAPGTNYAQQRGEAGYASVSAGAAPTASPGWRDRWFGAPRAAAPAMPTTPYASPASAPGGSFLGTAAASVAGVAGGMLLFNGLGHMLGSQQTAGNGWNSNSNANTTDRGSALSTNDNSGLDNLAQQAGRDHVGQPDTSPNTLLDDARADDSGDDGFGSNFSDGGDVFDDDNFA